MRTMDASNPSSEDESRIPASRLTVAQKRKLKADLAEEIESSGRDGTFALGVRSLVGETLGLDVSLSLVEKLLAEFGYCQTTDLQPYFDNAGTQQAAPIWRVLPPTLPLLPQDRTKVFAERLAAMNEDFVTDLLTDPLLKFSGLGDLSVEATRAFALALGAAVQARARFGAKTILPQCASTAQMAFSSVYSTGG